MQHFKNIFLKKITILDTDYKFSDVVNDSIKSHMEKYLKYFYSQKDKFCFEFN